MGLLRMLKYVLGTEDETQQPRQTQSSAKNANNAKPARTGQTKQTGQVARRVTQPQLQPQPIIPHFWNSATLHSVTTMLNPLRLKISPLRYIMAKL